MIQIEQFIQSQNKGTKQMINTQKTFEQILEQEIQKLDELDNRIDETAIEFLIVRKQIKQMEQDK